MAAPLESSVARIYSKSGKVIGAGFLVSSKHVLTCAHVVTDALGISRATQEQPDLIIHLDFPLLAAKQLFTAKVIFWQPVNPNQQLEDIAGLELETALPDTAQPAQLVTSEDLWGHPFRVLGFPAGQPNGVSASGVLRGRIANGWVQLEDVKQAGYRLEPGFSGAPVWDEELQGVAGIAVAAEMNRVDVKAAFIIPTTLLISAWSVLREQAISSCPYRGLFAFREQDAKFFFGREAFTKQLVAAVERQPLVAVIGPSGSGKSSVVFAGLVPQLRQQGDWLINSFRPGERPLRNLAAAMVPLLETQMSETDQLVEINKLATAFGEGNITLQDVVRRILEKHSSTRLLLVADQFEELYTLCKDESECQLFLDRFLEGLNNSPNFRLVFTLRADFLGYALSYRPFADALQNADVKLGPMNRQELQDAIAKPAQMLGVRIEEGLTERILAAVEKSPGNLPLLEFALTQLWAKQRNSQLTHDTYEEIGGVEKALASYAEEVYCLLSEDDKQRVQRVFIQLVRPGEGTEDTRRLATRAEVGEDNWDLVTGLANARLVVTGRDEGVGEETVEIVHEALIREWENLRGWLEADRSFRTWQERLRGTRGQWAATGKDEGGLLRGVPLAEAEEWQQKRSEQLSQAERRFIQASVALRDREKKQRKRQRRGTIIGLIGGLVGALILTMAVGWQWWQAELQRQQAYTNDIDTLIVSSQKLLISDKRFDALINVLRAGKKLKQEVWADADIRKRVEEVLQVAVDTVRERNRLEEHENWVYGVSFSPDGQMIATASADKTAKLWNRDGSLRTPPLKHDDKVYGVSFSPDGQTIATASGDKTVRLWNRDGSLRTPPLTHSNSVLAVSFSPDGKAIATASADKTVKLWSLDTQKYTIIGEHKDRVNGVSFSPDGKIIATASDDKTVKLWSLDGKEIKTLNRHTDKVSSVSFSPDGKTIATASWDKTALLWNRDGTLLRTLTGHSDRVLNVSFSPDGKTIATAGRDKTVKLWNPDGTLRTTLKGHSDGVRSVSFSPDGNAIASGSADNTVKLWMHNNSLLPIEGHNEAVRSVSFNPDGNSVASASEDKTAKLWNLDGTLLKSLNHGGRIYGVSFSPDGQIIATASADKTVKLWNRDGKELKTLKGHSDDVFYVSFSRDGKMIVTASADKTAKLWNRDGKELKTLKGHRDRVVDASFSPDGKMIATASDDGTAKLWNLDGILCTTLTGHDDEVNGVSFRPDGKMIATASDDYTIGLWKLNDTSCNTSKSYERFLKDNQTLKGHQDRVVSVKFSSNGKTIASASFDKTVKLWNQDGILLQTFSGHEDWVCSEDFSPDGTKLASAGNDKTVRLWNLNNLKPQTLALDNLLLEGCKHVRDYLKTNSNVSESDRHLCDGISAGK